MVKEDNMKKESGNQKLNIKFDIAVNIVMELYIY